MSDLLSIHKQLDALDFKILSWSEEHVTFEPIHSGGSHGDDNTITISGRNYDLANRIPVWIADSGRYYYDRNPRKRIQYCHDELAAIALDHMSGIDVITMGRVQGVLLDVAGKL